MDVPLPFIGGCYPENQISSAYNFVLNEGFYIITLHFEFFYNLSRMLISLDDIKENNSRDNSSIYFFINKTICPLLELINHILKQLSNIIFQYREVLDTMGFSLLKIFKLLISSSPLSYELLTNLGQFLLNLNRIYIKTKNINSKNIILNFMNRILIMIFDKKCFNMDNYKELNEHLNIFKKILKNNEYLISSKILDLLLNFRFILDKNNFEKKIEYKQMAHDYKNIMMIFISQMPTIKLHCEYIKKVCGNSGNIFILCL